MLPLRAEAYSNEAFHCELCKNDFDASVATWIDVSRTPSFRTALQRWEFNLVACPRCGNRQFSGSPFFYEDFAEGLLVAVFPTIPENRLSLEEKIGKQYDYYPHLEFFYDMTQLWFLIYLQAHYAKNRNPHTSALIGRGEKRLGRFLQFVKTEPLMLTLRDTLTDTFLGNKTSEDLQDVLWRALAKLEGGVPAGRDSVLSAGTTAK